MHSESSSAETWVQILKIIFLYNALPLVMQPSPIVLPASV